MLLLFDIDGTLVTGAAHEHALALLHAARTVYGVDDPESVPLDAAGRTDLEIVRLILLNLGVSAARIDEGLDDLSVQACEEFARTCPESLADRVVPGIAPLVAALAGRDDVRLALVTGNLEPIARLKLGRAGLGKHFAAGQGAFGSDEEDRAALPAIARARAGAPGAPHPRARTLVIGDTPRDIACARADGVRCVAVGTGPYGADELAGADAVARDAVELEALLDAELARS
ncbi:MAG TPA: haloacid dehalogenase-like hydrolase [Solirubrobacteraceae bacterium]|nr:haloacid dehalogenase-like hydrolase [Solirubrobacteraceae bacterium]